MEILLLIILLAVLATLLVALAVLCLIAMPLCETKTNKTKVRRVKRYRKVAEEVAPDTVKPDDSYDETEPIESFEPDFSKPIKVTVSKDAKKHTVDDEELTPIETDDLAEEDDEELIKKGLK